MNTKTILIILASALVIVGFVAFAMHGTATPGTTTQSGVQASGASQSQAATNSSKVLFSNSRYAPYSYLIAPGPISQQAQSALSGFNLTSSQLQNGSTEVHLSLIGTNQNESITLGQGEKLYMVDTTLGDDGYHFDSSLGDDGFILVNATGYVV